MNDEIPSYEDFVKSIDVYQVMVDLESAWEAVKESTLKNCWSKLLGNPVKIEPEFIDFQSLLDQIPELSYVNDDILEKWINSDHHDKGFAVYEDEMIISAVSSGKDPLELLETDDDEENEIETSNDNREKGSDDNPLIMNKETTMQSLKSCIDWAKMESNANEKTIFHLNAALSELENL